MRAASMLVVLLAVVGSDVACDAVPECHAVPALVLQRTDKCVFQGAYGSCAPAYDTASCTVTVCCAQPDDPGTLYGSPCKCPEDLRPCTADETQEYESSASRSCAGGADGGVDSASDAGEVDAMTPETPDAPETE